MITVTELTSQIREVILDYKLFMFALLLVVCVVGLMGTFAIIKDRRRFFVFMVLSTSLYWFPAYLLGWGHSAHGVEHGLEILDVPMPYKILRLFPVGLMIVSLFMSVMNSRKFFIPNVYKWILFYLVLFWAMSFLHCLYVDRDPKIFFDLTAKYIYFAAIFWVATYGREHNDIIQNLTYLFSVILAINLVAEIYHFTIGPRNQLDYVAVKRSLGTLGGPHSFSISLGFVVILFFSQLMMNRREARFLFLPYYVWIVIALVLMVLSQSTTGFLCTMIGIFAVLCVDSISRNNYMKLVVSILLLSTLLLSLAPQLIKNAAKFQAMGPRVQEILESGGDPNKVNTLGDRLRQYRVFFSEKPYLFLTGRYVDDYSNINDEVEWIMMIRKFGSMTVLMFFVMLGKLFYDSSKMVRRYVVDTGSGMDFLTLDQAVFFLSLTGIITSCVTSSFISGTFRDFPVNFFSWLLWGVGIRELAILEKKSLIPAKAANL